MINFFKRIWNFFFPEKIGLGCGSNPLSPIGRDDSKICNYCRGQKQMLWKGKMTDCHNCQGTGVHFIYPDVPLVKKEHIRQPEPEIERANLMMPERGEHESFEHYRERRRLVKKKIKQKLNGKLVFNSQNLILDKTGRQKGLSFKKGRTFVNTKSK